jgi:hypothetical protein
MRNPLAIDRKRNFEDMAAAEHADSPDQVAVVWDNSGGVVVASPRPASGVGYEIDTVHFPSDFNLAGAINLRRVNRPDVAELSNETLYLTSVRDYSERTRLLALDGEKLAMSDEDLAEWLIGAERQVFLGTDNHPLFETSLEETACSISRLPSGQVTMTEVPRTVVESARDRMRQITGTRSMNFDLCVETPLRSTARYFLTALPEGDVVLRPGKEREVTAFLLIGKSGYSYGLWSPSTGLFSEYAFLAPKEIDHRGRAAKDVAPADNIGGQRNVEDYVRYAFDQLLLQLSPDKLERLELSSYAQIVWTADADLIQTTEPLAAEQAQRAGLEFFQIKAPADEAVAAGLLFGSFAFGDSTVAGADLLPQVNLARDILALADTEEFERRQNEEVRLMKRRSSAVFTLLAAPVATAGILLAIFGTIIFSQMMTAYRDSRADARTAELKPALDRRNSYEANLKWYQEFIKQVSRLRKQQPAGIGLMYQMNSNYPFAIDPAFYVSDMKLLPTGAVEMRGLARNKDAIASFLKTLEFAGGPESGSRLFSNLAYEVQESAGAPAAVPGQPALPVMTGSALSSSTIAPGVISWSIKGNYLPVAEFAPPPPAKPGTPPAATTAATRGAAAANAAT